MATPDDSQIGTQPCVCRSPAELALAERLLAAARAGADVRGRKVRRLKAAIKVRVYENDLKFTVAMERLVAAAREPVPPKAGHLRPSRPKPDAHAGRPAQPVGPKQLPRP